MVEQLVVRPEGQRWIVMASGAVMRSFPNRDGALGYARNYATIRAQNPKHHLVHIVEQSPMPNHPGSQMLQSGRPGEGSGQQG